jgi:hypothetical protein
VHRHAITGRYVSPNGSRHRSEAALKRADAAIERLSRIKF